MVGRCLEAPSSRGRLPGYGGKREDTLCTTRGTMVAILPSHIHASMPPWVYLAHDHQRAHHQHVGGVHRVRLPGSVWEKPMGGEPPSGLKS